MNLLQTRKKKSQLGTMVINSKRKYIGTYSNNMLIFKQYQHYVNNIKGLQHKWDILPPNTSEGEEGKREIF